MQKTYILNPNITFRTLNTSPAQRKAAAGALPASPKPALPPRQPLPQPVIDPAKPRLQLGLDVHLELIMGVSQRGNTSAQAPRKFTLDQLVEQVRQWVAQGLQVFCVQESCGFGFVLHRQLVAAGAQSSLTPPTALNDKHKPDRLDPRALSLLLPPSRDGTRAD